MSPRQLTRQSTTVLQSTSASPAEKGKFQQLATLFEDFVKAVENGQKEQANLTRGDFQQGFSELQVALDRNHHLQQQLSEMQQLMLEMQQQALDRIAATHGVFQKYGRYMLTLLEMIKHEVTVAGYAVPVLSATSATGAIDTLKDSMNTLSLSAVNRSIEYLQSLSSENLG
ncbi:hypothetical protein BG015_005063, partial [Linnemannia schmuckeri]